MEDSLMRKYKRAVHRHSISKNNDNLTTMYLSLIQDHFRKAAITGAILTLNWIVVRRVFLPQFGVQSAGLLRNAALDLFPGLCYINFQSIFRLSNYSDAIAYLDRTENKNNPFIAKLKLEEKDKRDANLKNLGYLFNSQYWH